MCDRDSSVYKTAFLKLYIKLILIFLVCIVITIITAAMKMETTMVLVPAGISLIPVLIGVYYYILNKKGYLTGTICTCFKRSRDVAGGIATASLSRRKYHFKYLNENGEEETFWITRSGLSLLQVDDKYLVIHHSSRKLDAGNFISCASIN